MPMFLFIVALIITIIFLILILILKNQNQLKRRRIIQSYIALIIFISVSLSIAGISAIGEKINKKSIEEDKDTRVVAKFDNDSFKTDSKGYYDYKVSSTKNANIRIENNKYIISKKSGKNYAEAKIKLPNNIKKVNISYIGKANGKISDKHSYSIYNNSDEYKQLKAANAKKEEKKEEAEEQQEEQEEQQEAQREKQEKQEKEAKFEAEYPPIQSKLGTNPSDASQDQQGGLFSITGKIIDLGANDPTADHFIIRDNYGNEYLVVSQKGMLKNFADIDDELKVYTSGIFNTNVNASQIQSGISSTHYTDPIIGTVVDKVVIKHSA